MLLASKGWKLIIFIVGATMLWVSRAAAAGSDWPDVCAWPGNEDRPIGRRPPGIDPG
jgi:hypothetical protein